MAIDLNVKFKTVKHLEESLYDHGVGKNFLAIEPKAWPIEE